MAFRIQCLKCPRVHLRQKTLTIFDQGRGNGGIGLVSLWHALPDWDQKCNSQRKTTLLADESRQPSLQGTISDKVPHPYIGNTSTVDVAYTVITDSK